MSWYLSSLFRWIRSRAFEIFSARSDCFWAEMAAISAASSASLASDLSRNFSASLARTSCNERKQIEVKLYNIKCYKVRKTSEGKTNPIFLCGNLPLHFWFNYSNILKDVIKVYRNRDVINGRTFLLSCQPRCSSRDFSFNLSRFSASSSGPSGARISLTFCHSCNCRNGCFPKLYHNKSLTEMLLEINNHFVASIQVC